MNKQEFLAALAEGLTGLPQADVEERLAFYGEMIDDRMEEGLTEEEAVKEAGPVQDIVSQILAEIPLSRLVKERVSPGRALRAWEIVLLTLGAPVWLSLLIAVLAAVLSAYGAIWAALVSLWAAGVGAAGCAIAGGVSFAVLASQGHGLQSIAVLGAGIACAGVSILLFAGAEGATGGILLFTKRVLLGIKRRSVAKGSAR